MSRRYTRPGPGVPITLHGRKGCFHHKVMCCDCGLVHIFRHTIYSPSRMTTQAWRAERATASARRAIRSIIIKRSQ